jgi:magnesium chelatase family protein
MGVARIASRAQVGLTAPPVAVEVHLSSGLPNFSIVGLAATAVKESKERVRSALATCGFEFPPGRITVNLGPADLPKEGGRFDLPIAVGILLASGQLVADAPLDDLELYGELGLAGEVKPVRGLLLAAAHAARAGHAVIVPEANADEAAIAAPQLAVGVASLLATCGHLAGTAHIGARGRPSPVDASVDRTPDVRDVRGQAVGRRALEVAASGGHSLLFVGPPGTGKSLLAQRLAPLLPPLTEREALEVALLASASGAPIDTSAWGRRPFRSPHHTASASAVVGGGRQARPGEISLAHLGVLFLDELPEFDRRVLEALREPLESGAIAITRAAYEAVYPARFQLVAAMNPCPCGFLGDDGGRCRCGAAALRRYRARVSGPLLDRIDLRIEIARPGAEPLLDESAADAEDSAAVAARVAATRARQLARAGRLNAALGPSEIDRDVRPDRLARQLLVSAERRLALSARGVHRVLRVARTLADMDGADEVATRHVAEAIQLRRGLDDPEHAAAARSARDRRPARDDLEGRST